VILMPCSAEQFKDDQVSRCLLYVAISRPSHRLMLVIPRKAPSPLFKFLALIYRAECCCTHGGNVCDLGPFIRKGLGSMSL
jgi:hypothetical protein